MEQTQQTNLPEIGPEYINLKKILEVNKTRVILDADTYLPVGDNYKDAFNDYLNTKFLGK